MELDKRIKEGKKPLSCLDTDEAKKFIGKEGYFTDCLVAFTDISRNDKKWMLKAIDEKAQSCFKDADGVRWDYFLPAEWVKPKEPESKWRAFKDHAEYKEFLNDGIIESWIKIREKETKDTFEVMYVGGGEDIIYLGGRAFSLSYLFEQYELFNENTQEWLPFGVKGEDEE